MTEDRGFTVVDNRAAKRALAAQARSISDRVLNETALSREQLEANVRSLAGNLWWQAQAAQQRGDHVRASACHIQRTRVIAVAKQQGLRVG